MNPNLLWILLLGIYVQQSASQMVQCFSAFSISTGKCADLLGETEKDFCCINPSYGFAEADGVCRSCGHAAWSEWSSWSQCSVSCTEGVTQRRRFCYGNGSCSDPEDLGTIQTKPCVKKDCCPEDGGWSKWGNWQPCSVTCENGQKKRQRACSNPAPKCGGSCSGEPQEIEPCSADTVCPTHGGWSTWGNWGRCPVTCIEEGRNTQKEVRTRTCTNPSPSTAPPGRFCEGSEKDTRPCSGLPFCPIDGSWGSWSGSSACSVTCGVGRQMQSRICDSPSPKHGGKPCHGVEQKSSLCSTLAKCPIHGRWTEWSEWSICKSQSTRKITCRTREGTRRKLRDCVGTEHEGKLCDGEIVEHGSCFDIDKCDMKGILSEWSEWSYCKPDCGQDSKQTRSRKCVPDISEYQSDDYSLFYGKPVINCEKVKDETETRPCKNVPQC